MWRTIADHLFLILSLLDKEFFQSIAPARLCSLTQTFSEVVFFFFIVVFICCSASNVRGEGRKKIDDRSIE